MFLLWLRQLPQCGNQTPAPVPLPAKGRWEKLLFSPLVPSSYWVLHGSIYSFPLVRYSCLLSAGVLHALLCLKVYSWCILGENCIPHPPTPPPFCSLDPQHIVLPNWRQLHRLSKLQPVQQKMTLFLIHNQHPKQPYLWSQCGSGGWLCAKWLSSQNLASCSAAGKGSHKTRSTVRQMPLLIAGWPPNVLFSHTGVASRYLKMHRIQHCGNQDGLLSHTAMISVPAEWVFEDTESISVSHCHIHLYHIFTQSFVDRHSHLVNVDRCMQLHNHQYSWEIRLFLYCPEFICVSWSQHLLLLSSALGKYFSRNVIYGNIVCKLLSLASFS